MTTTATRPGVTGARVAVATVFFVHGVLFASWAAHIPHVKARLGIDDGTLGFALLGTPIGSVSAIAAASVLVPKFGSRLLVRVCLVGYCLSGPLVGLAGTVPALFLALFVWGAFMGTLDIAMNTQAIAVEKQHGRPLMNGMHGCWSIGAFVGAGLGTGGVALGVGLATQLWIIGVPLLVGAGLLTLRMIPDRMARPEPHEEPAPRSKRFTTAVVVLGAVAFASMLVEGAAADWSSVYLRDSLGGGAAAAGLGYTSFALAMLAVRLGGDRLLARRPATVVLPVLAGIATVAFAVALGVGEVPVAIAGFFVLGGGVAVIVPSAFSAAGRLPGVHPGVGVATVSGLGWAGFVCGPPIIGQLSGATSLPVALILIPVLTGVVAIACTRIRALDP